MKTQSGSKLVNELEKRGNQGEIVTVLVSQMPKMQYETFISRKFVDGQILVDEAELQSFYDIMQKNCDDCFDKYGTDAFCLHRNQFPKSKCGLGVMVCFLEGLLCKEKLQRIQR